MTGCRDCRSKNEGTVPWAELLQTERSRKKRERPGKMLQGLKKHKYYLILLTALFFVLIYLFVPEGSVFGSNTDWMSQHATLAETIRDACLSQGTLFPDFLWLGGGSSAYEFSYYGYLRPDVLLGCLLPQVPMIYILIGCMMACVLASGLLCYALLIQNDTEPYLAFIGSVLMMTAGCFFQAHRQVMFINYMPWETAGASAAARAGEKRQIYPVYDHACAGNL